MRSRMVLGKTKPSPLLRSKNTYLADLPPGNEARGKSEGVSARGTSPPRDHVQSKTELKKRFVNLNTAVTHLKGGKVYEKNKLCYT